ncbi:MAG: hypothetical protein NC402_07590 [Prevotella sp.]|nr:hypothetical protein [Prevotella sp.]MCM1075600.1 hypothetical protein [Ruminococcus sp.]
MNAIEANGVSNSNVIMFSFNVSQETGLDSLTIEDADITIYNLNGVIVFKGKAAEIGNSLKGLFIVNGKKVIF